MTDCEFCRRQWVNADELAEHLCTAHGVNRKDAQDFVDFLLHRDWPPEERTT